jgi:hypothetical protein
MLTRFINLLPIIFFLQISCEDTVWAKLYPSGTYYVDAANGNDSSPDPTNINTPWKTLVMVSNNTFTPPITIALKKGGTWNGFLMIPSSGMPGKEFTITSYGTGSKPLIKRSAVITKHTAMGWTYLGGKIWSYPVKVITRLYENGKGLKRASSSNLSDGSWFSENDRVYYRPKTGSGPADNLIEYVTGASVSNDKDYITVDGIAFTQGQFWNSASGNRTNLTIRNCDFYDMCGAILYLGGGRAGYHNVSNITIEENTFDYNDTNIYLYEGWFSGTIIRNNIIKHSNLTYWGEHTQNCGDADGISLQNQADGLFEGNDISGGCFGSAGITHWINPHARSTGNIFTRNHIHDVEGGGIITGGGANDIQSDTISYNIIKNFGTGKACMPHEGAWGGIRLDKRQKSATPSQVMNNFIYNGDIGVFFASLSNYYIVKNNTINTMSKCLINNKCHNLQNIIDSNIYFQPAGDTGMFHYRKHKYNFARWKMETGQDGGSTFAALPWVIP